ncbi:MAG TPA: acyl carrier protein [Bryobacteraceae bacterium]|nr:acyl carrier protein [Bryobacteraceae bacterium]
MDKRTKIISIIQSVSPKPANPSPEESLFDSGILDSFSLADLVAALEKEFSIRIPDSDLQPRKFDTVERIEKYVESRI